MTLTWHPVPWDTPADAVSLADLRALNVMMAGTRAPFGDADDDANGYKALGESQAKFDARRPRRKRGRDGDGA